MVGGAVFAPTLPTCRENTYDFFVVSKCIAHAVFGVQRLDDVGANESTKIVGALEEALAHDGAVIFANCLVVAHANPVARRDRELTDVHNLCALYAV